MADIGTPEKEITVEPIHLPERRPVEEPAPVKEPAPKEPVPVP